MYRILLADDTKLTLAVEKAYLEARNLKVFATTNPSEVLPLARTVRPDLIIMDYEMPELNGDEVCRRLKQANDTAGIPVLILSASDKPEVRQLCQDAGATAFARKMDGRELLLDLVAEILGVPQRRHLRAPCRFSVGILESGSAQEGTLHDVSEGGVYLTTDRRLTAGVAMRLHFRLPSDDREIVVLGEIVRTEDLDDGLYGYGIQFIEADPESRKALASYTLRTI